MFFHSIGVLPLFMSLMLSGLFYLKFQRESKLTEYSLRLESLIDESKFDESVTWEDRRAKYFAALKVLDEAREDHVDLDELLEQAIKPFDLPSVYGAILAHNLQKNLRIADELALLTEKNFELLEAGERLRIGSGGHKGEQVILDNIVPHRYSPELEMRFGNLLLKPESIWRSYPDRIRDDAIPVMSACRSAELMTETSYARALTALKRTSGNL